MCTFLVAVTQTVFPWIRKLIIDDVLISGNPGKLVGVILLFIAAIGATLAFEILRNYLFTYVGESSVIDLRNHLLKHMRQLSIAYFHREKTGKLMSIFTNDVSSIENLYQSMIASVIHNVMQVGVSLAIVIAIDWKLTLIAISFCLPFVVFSLSKLSKLVRRAARQVLDKNADIMGNLQESIVATRDIIGFAREPWDIARLGNLFRQMLPLRIRQTLLQSGSFSVGYLAGWLPSIFVFLIGGRKVLAAEMSVGVLFAFVGYIDRVILQARHFVSVYNQIQTSMGAVDRVFEFLDTEPEIRDSPEARELLNDIKGKVEFDHVTFAYDNREPVLKEICLEANPGQTIAIVGKSGSGKSTLVNLIPRFYEPQSGRILVDGHSIRDVTAQSFRRHIGIVFQDTFLFSTSILENIRFGSLEASEEQVVAAAKAANAHEFIMQMPQGYNTTVGERGVKLSGGQRQRVAIARTILRDPRILILDEATSALDSESERAVQEALEHLMEGRTTLVIAHRLSTVMKADQIIVLDQGRVVETGTHEQLLRRGGLYYRLYTTQFSTPEEASTPQGQEEEKDSVAYLRRA